MIETTRGRWIAGGLFALLLLAAVVPVRSYDLFWHLATGRWIVEHRTLPAGDPFAVASDRHDWINGEWLFQVAAHGLQSAVGTAGLSWARAALAALIFTIAFLRSRRDAGDHVALLLAAVAFAGAAATLDLRPSGLAALFVLLALVTRSVPAYAVLTILWMNVHPSALLAPWIALVRDGGEVPPREWLRLPIRRPAFLASAGALLVNPHGLAGVTAPLELMSWVRSGAFVNAEWLPSSPRLYPLLYLCVALAAIVFATAADRRAQAWRIVLAVTFGWLAIRHVRNQPLFFAAFPLLLAPAVRAARVPRSLAWAASAAAIVFVAAGADHRTGVPPERFPLRAVARLRATGLRGNVYNPDQFGGFLIWSFYPERRVLTDGRNELYRQFIPEYARARVDERAWRALLARYRIDVAVDEYRPPLPVIDAVSGRRTRMPASLAYWPRDEWALIAFDDAAMVFARREAWPEGVLRKWEIRGVVPDAN